MTSLDDSHSRTHEWTIRLIAGMHFIRLIFLQTIMMIIILSFNRTFTISDIVPVLIFIPIVILDFLIGFYILDGSATAITFSTIYATFIFLPNIFRLIFPFYLDILTIPFYSSFVELLLVMFMGILRLNIEWVRDPSDTSSLW
ncbi:hypothetical protein EU528_05065 [Candidatus Thorarchaeota archaeon]|nr:MAG: hypothetical protein EU528_05065 [Candidatus Thorarchaeota archaeon]